MFELIRNRIHRTRFSVASSARARLWQRIGSLTSSGVPITAAVEFLHQSNRSGVAAHFIEHQRLTMRTSGFSAAAKGWVPQEELIIIEVTQERNIADGFEQAARIASVRSRLRHTLISGLAYPTILLFGGGAVIAVLPGYALNVMIEIMDISKWPPVSRSVLVFSEFISNWGLPLATVLIMLMSVSVWAAPHWTGALRRRLEWYPPFALYRQFCGPEVLTAWLALMEAGTQRIRALSQLESGLPQYLASHVRSMRSQLYQGKPVETALDTGLFSAETLDDLRIYERTGNFSIHASRIAEEDITRALEKLESTTKTLSSCLLILIGAAAIWIYVGVARVAFTVQQQAF